MASDKQGRSRASGHANRMWLARRRYRQVPSIGRQPEQAQLNTNEVLVLSVLTDQVLLARELAELAGIPVNQVRRALATLKAKELVSAERRGGANGWVKA